MQRQGRMALQSPELVYAKSLLNETLNLGLIPGDRLC